MERMSAQEFADVQAKSQEDIATNKVNKEAADSELMERQASLDTLTGEKKTLEETKTATRAEFGQSERHA